MNHRGVYYTPTCDAIKDPVNKHRKLVANIICCPNVVR